MFNNKKPLILLCGVLAVFLGIFIFSKIGAGASSFTEAINKGYAVEKGSYEISFSSNETSEKSTFTNPTYKITGKTDGTLHSLGFEYDNNGQVSTLEDVVFIDTNYIYIKAAPIMNFISSTYGVIFNTSGLDDKWLTVNLPQLTTESTDYVALCKTSIVNTIKTALQNESSEKDGSQFIIKKENGADASVFMGTIADTLLSQSDTLSKDISNIISKFNKESIDKYASGITPNGVNLSQENIKKSLTSLSKIMKTGSSKLNKSTNAGLSISASFTGKKNSGTFKQEVIAQSLTDDGHKTIKILYTFKGGNKIKLQAPEKSSCFTSDSSNGYIQRLVLEIYKILNSNAASNSKESYEPKYSITTTNNLVTCHRTNSLFNESITYTINNETVSNIVVTITSPSQRAFNALVNYYTTIGYSLTGQSHENGYSASLVAQAAYISKTYASITNVEDLVNVLQ